MTANDQTETEVIRRLMGVSPDAGPVFMPTGRERENDRHAHFDPECGLLAAAPDLERYETVADLPRIRPFGSFGRMPPALCSSCGQIEGRPDE